MINILSLAVRWAKRQGSPPLFWLLMTMIYVPLTVMAVIRVALNQGNWVDWIFLPINPVVLVACGFITGVKLHDKIKGNVNA